MILKEQTVADRYLAYFHRVAEFILDIDRIRQRLEAEQGETWTLAELQRENREIYGDIIGEQYESSFANPAYAVAQMGEESGRILSFLYTEIRREIPYVYEKRMEYLTICNELFIEIYNCFEGVDEPDYKEVKSIIYW
jgi:hypothetical protein